MPPISCDTADSLDARQLEEPAPQGARPAGPVLQLTRLAIHAACDLPARSFRVSLSLRGVAIL